jgi:Na+/proline symporter
MIAKKEVSKMRVTVTFLAAWIALCSLAQSSFAQESQQAPSPDIKLKSESTAFTLSLVGAAVPLTLLSLAAILDNSSSADDVAILAWAGMLSLPIGPSLGYFYGGLPWRGLLGIGVRTITGLGLIATIWAIFDPAEVSAGALGFIVGGLCAANIVYDVASVKGAVRKRNVRTQEKSLAIVPLLNPRSKAVGIQVQFSF